MDVLWERMTKIYGHKWTSSFGTLDDGTWLAGLHDVNADQIRSGIEKCRTGNEWPPSLPEFRAMCLNKKTGLNEFGLDYIPECYRPAPIVDRSKLLSSSKRDGDRSALLAKMAAMKAALK